MNDKKQVVTLTDNLLEGYAFRRIGMARQNRSPVNQTGEKFIVGRIIVHDRHHVHGPCYAALV